MKRSQLKADPGKAADRRQRREARRAAEGPRPEDLAREERRKAAGKPRSHRPLQGVCFCGCKQPTVARHHCVTEQTIRKVVAAGRSTKRSLPADDRELLTRLVTDPRNLVNAAATCHGAHHGKSQPYPLAALPDSVFEFAAEVLGARAHGYLRRRYVGCDERLDELFLIGPA